MSNDLSLAVRALRQGELSVTQLVLPPDLPYKEYEKIGAALGAISRATRWALGDWIIYGEQTYGEKYAQAIEATGLSHGYLRNVVSTCRRVAPSRRREGVYFSVHTEVAALEPKDQKRWLRIAEKEHLTSDVVRQRIREEQGLLQEPAGPPAATRDRQTGSVSLDSGAQARAAILSERTTSGLPHAYVVPGPVVRRLVHEAVPWGDGTYKVPRELIERLKIILDEVKEAA